MSILSRIISCCLIFIITVTVVQSGCFGSDYQALKKIEQAKKSCEDTSEEETSDDNGENELEQFISSLFNFNSPIHEGPIKHHTQVDNYCYLRFQNINTPPPEFEFYSSL